MADIMFDITLPVRAHVTAYGGDVRRWGLLFSERDTEGAKSPMDLTGNHLAQVRLESDSAEVLATVVVDDADAATGQMRWMLSAGDTHDLVTGEHSKLVRNLDGTRSRVFSGAWDSEWTDPQGEPVTVARGRLTVEQDVSRD